MGGENGKIVGVVRRGGLWFFYIFEWRGDV